MISLIAASAFACTSETPWTRLSFDSDVKCYTFRTKFRGKLCNTIFVLGGPNTIYRRDLFNETEDETYETAQEPERIDLTNGTNLKTLVKRGAPRDLPPGIDLQLGFGAFLGTKFSWDITKHRFSFTENGVEVGTDSLSPTEPRFSLETGKFSFRGNSYYLPSCFEASLVGNLDPSPKRVHFMTGKPFLGTERNVLLFQTSQDQTDVISVGTFRGEGYMVGANFFGNQTVEIDFRSLRIKFEDVQGHRSAHLLNVIADVRFVYKNGEALLEGHDGANKAALFRKLGMLGGRLSTIGDLKVTSSHLNDPELTRSLIDSWYKKRRIGIEKDGTLHWIGQDALD
jgi:hypothetical protein